MRIVIADDSALLREGVAGIVEKGGHQVVGRAGNASEMMEVVDQKLPDLLITDVRMPPEMKDDGLRVAVELRKNHPHLNIMVLSQYVAPVYARELFERSSGGTGYLLKDRVAQVMDFLSSLETVGAGGVVIDPEVASALMRSGHSGLADLSIREREVLELMARGKSNKQIAQDLYLSGAAVAKHVSNIFSKLQLQPGEENRRVRAILTYLTQTSERI